MSLLVPDRFLNSYYLRLCPGAHGGQFHFVGAVFIHRSQRYVGVVAGVGIALQTAAKASVAPDQRSQFHVLRHQISKT